MQKVEKLFRPQISSQELPVFIARIAAGFPSPAADYEEGKLDLNKHLIKNPAATFFVRVAGDSMVGVSLCIENVWNKFLLSPLEMRDFIDGFESKRVGSYFDVGNVLLTGYPDQWIKILGKRIKRVHIKDFKTSLGTAEGFVDLGEGDVDFEAVKAALCSASHSASAAISSLAHIQRGHR